MPCVCLLLECCVNTDTRIQKKVFVGKIGFERVSSEQSKAKITSLEFILISLKVIYKA